MTATIDQTIDDLRQTLTGYIEAAYHIGHPTMVRQRRRLLEEVGGIFQTPYLESTPRYTAGRTYADMAEIPAAAREAYLRLSDPELGHVIFNPPYKHQDDAIREILANRRNLMLMTGTGSGKTESFLLPILGKFAIEAKERPASFRDNCAVRAIVLYPMNALVNDQLGRLRLLFGNPRVVEMFEAWAGRPARFARYTSRTPYAGVRSPTKDSNRLGSIGDFFVGIEDAARHDDGHDPEVGSEQARAADLFEALRTRGKWPAKPSVSEWFGKSGERWQDRNGRYKRAVVRAHDAELLTRHEVQENPPDLLITNYSMLEYMMMRPIERPIFDKTRAWLDENPNERMLVVMDEAHLYRGAQGAEVGLLLRRLRDRLGIGTERFQVICATASFNDTQNAGSFGAQLTGAPVDSFACITGSLLLREPHAPGSVDDVDALCRVDLKGFYDPSAETQQEAIRPFLRHRRIEIEEGTDEALFRALEDFAPFNRLVNKTMSKAVALGGLGAVVFPDCDRVRAAQATGILLALGSRARTAPDAPSLLPCRIHTFFRGLPGLWICMDPECRDLPAADRGGPAGRMYSQPRERCTCGAPVLEYFTCRYCGTSYARAYTNDVAHPRLLWANPGKRLQTGAGFFEAFQPIDLLLEEPSKAENGRASHFDLDTALLDPVNLSARHRIVYLRPNADAIVGGDDERRQGERPGEFVPCACCEKTFWYGQSSVQDHQTKGDQPFQALLATQIKIQPPGPQAENDFAPLRGRKVLIFSDSRQMAARLAPTLQNYSLQDTVKALLPAGFRMLAADPQFGQSVVLDNAFLAVLIAAHRFRIRVRPELEGAETMPSMPHIPAGQLPTGADLLQLMNERCPSNLMRAIVNSITDLNLGLDALAVASIREVANLSAQIERWPDLPGLADDPASKLAVARQWLRCWVRDPGIWFRDMPNEWWNVEVRPHRGAFTAMDRVLNSREAKRAFTKEWLSRLIVAFTHRLPDGGMRILANKMAFDIGGAWRRCLTCKSVHRPIARLASCVDCGSQNIQDFDPDTDEVFKARRAFYRDPIVDALRSDEPKLISLIAAEHTAQLNAAQPDDAFSQAENHEIRFQDIDLAWRDTDDRQPAIDVLSSTTTMEVGIDIGALSGVALRNMPPGRANYQQRSGRAGRRGNAVATVVAFGSSDSHDDHYFVAPDEMICGPVTDPRLTLENPYIANRHVRAFLLQRYHEARIPDVDPGPDPSLFSVLGSVMDFRDGTGVLNREDLAVWLGENREDLEAAVNGWLPSELPPPARQELVATMVADLLREVDDAIGFVGAQPAQVVPAGAVPADDADDADENGVIENQDDERVDPASDKLLDRLLYRGVLPRYAFPTDVAPFYVFNRDLSTPYRPKMLFAPSQGLNIALSQYAPNKQIWIRGKQYTSKAIYSPYRSERSDAWRRRRLYFECTHCSHAKTEEFVEANLNQVRACEACRSPGTFGPAKRWFRPPGFAHPVDLAPVSTPDASIETAYATRAKLVMQTPAAENAWIGVNHRVRAFRTRDHLLVSNSGPDGDGYAYCTSCGRIEAARNQEINLFQPHSRPYPSDEGPCPGTATAHGIVLGTDFVTDICLFSLTLDEPFQLRPGNDETASALRTLCEALAKSACRMLELESGEILAEYRPAFTAAGARGLQAEIFIYDTLAGGAGFSTQLATRVDELFERTLATLEECPQHCDASCYRCLRSFRNKLDHYLLDRQLAGQLLRHVLHGGYPEYPPERMERSLDLLNDDLRRQLGCDFRFERNVEREVAPHQTATIPIVATRLATNRETWAALASPIAPDTPTNERLRNLGSYFADRILCVDDQVVRRHLPAAVSDLARRLA